jgi:antitoxin MazE
MQTHIARWGNSLALRIPRPIADRLGLDEGGTVELSVEEGHLLVRPRWPEPRLDELLAGITPENLPSSFDDAPQGEEAL